MIKKILVLLFLISSVNLVFADEIDLNVYLDKNSVSLEEPFTLTIEISGLNDRNVEQPILPNLPFKNIGLYTGENETVTIIQGKLTSSKKLSFTYTLQPTKIGSFTIPPINVKIAGKSYKTNSLMINVVKGQSKTNTNNFQYKKESTISKDDVFIKVFISKSQVYKNEPFIVKYILYSVFQPQNYSYVTEPNFSSFWKEDLQKEQDQKGYVTNYNGRKYLAIDLSTLSLTPTRSGRLSIPSFVFDVDINVPSSSLFSWGINKRIRLTTQEQIINALELPDNSNPSFTGAIGQFSVNSSINLQKLKAGESFTYSLIVNGKGNLKQFSNPIFPSLSKMKVLDPESEVILDNNNDELKGKRIFKYTCIPQEEGLYVIPPLNFTYFDPIKKQYISLQTKEIKILTEKGNIVLNSDNSQNMIKKEGSDIGFIETKMSFQSYNINFKTLWYWIIIISLFISVPMHYLYKMEQDKLAANIEYLRNRTARKILKKYLKEAFNAYHHHHINEFYDSSMKGLSLFLCDKLSIPRGSTYSEIIENFKIKVLNKTLSDEVEQFMNKCSQVKYMPGDTGSETFKNDYFYLKSLVDQLIKILK